MISRPLLMEPKVVPRVWGGQRLFSEFGRALPNEPIGESWEIHGDLKVQGTESTLDQLVEKHGKKLLGTSVNTDDGFPLLAKWLDCKAWLSVQVHPDDALAREFTGDPSARGKTEAWYVYRSEPEAELMHGLANDVSSEELQMARGEKILELTKRIRTRSGQLFHTPAGAVHALGPGNLIYEIQQSCDQTYRFYDWGRDREVNFDRALDCVKRSQQAVGCVTDTELVCPYFTLELLAQSRSWTVDERSFQILVTTGDRVSLKWSGGELYLEPGRSVVLPANLGRVELIHSGDEAVILIGVPDEN